MKYVLCAIAALALAGCAELKVVSENDRSVVVQGPIEAWAKTTPMADRSCAKSGLRARFRYNTDGYPANYFYDCVN